MYQKLTRNEPIAKMTNSLKAFFVLLSALEIFAFS